MLSCKPPLAISGNLLQRTHYKITFLHAGVVEGCGGVFSSNIRPFSRRGHNNDSRHSAHYARSYSPHPMILANDDMVSNFHTYQLRVLENHKTCHLSVLEICAPAISGGGAYYYVFYPAVAGRTGTLTLPAPYCRLRC